MMKSNNYRIKTMKKRIFICALTVILLMGCKETPRNEITPDSESNDTIVSGETSHEIPTGDGSACQESEALVWEDETFSSYTEDKIRGSGIVSFTMDINDRLTILNEDDSSFGEIVLNEDMTYFTLTMPKKIVARKVIPNYDFASFDFDCENVNADKDYLMIYINKQKKKVKKTDLKYTFLTWENYIKKQFVQLKTCNLILDAQGKINPKSKGLAFAVTEIKDDAIKIKSVKDCNGEDKPFYDMKGKVKWKSGDVLLIDLAICN